MKKATVALMVFVLGLGLGPVSLASAQSDETAGTVLDVYSFDAASLDLAPYAANWNAWVLDGVGTAYFVTDDGRHLEVTLPAQVPEGDMSRDVAASDTGARLFYAIFSTDLSRVAVHVYSVLSGRVDVVEIAPPRDATFGNLRLGPDFSGGGDAVTFRLSYDGAGQPWQIFVWELPSTVNSLLPDTDPSLSESLGADASFFFPATLYLGMDRLEFELFPAAGEAYFGESFVWDFDTHTVAPGGTAGYPGQRLSATGEIAYLDFDGDYLSCECERPYIYNVVKVFDPETGSARTVFNEMLVSLRPWHIAWIEGGARLAVAVPNDDRDYTTMWAIDRSVGLQSLISLNSEHFDMVGVPGGLLLSAWTDEVFELYELSTARYRELRKAWRVPLAEDALPMLVVWVTPQDPTAPLEAFSDLAPVRLAVGEQAIINSTGGDHVNMRGGPGLGNAVVEKLDEETVVDIIGGPTPAGDLIWWEVQTPDGTTGWVAEYAWYDDYGVRLLVPLIELYFHG